MSQHREGNREPRRLHPEHPDYVKPPRQYGSSDLSNESSDLSPPSDSSDVSLPHKGSGALPAKGSLGAPSSSKIPGGSLPSGSLDESSSRHFADQSAAPVSDADRLKGVKASYPWAYQEPPSAKARAMIPTVATVQVLAKTREYAWVEPEKKSTLDKISAQEKEANYKANRKKREERKRAKDEKEKGGKEMKKKKT